MKNTRIHIWLTIFMVITIITSCNRQFDLPPENADPEVEVTMTIMQLKARYLAIGDFKRIEDEQIISGVVIADDRSGNFYKQIIIQDETGGIPILLDANNVYTQYPVGRRVFVRLKGMMLGDYGGTIQIGLDSSRSDDGRFLNLDGIPQALFDQYLIKGSFNNKLIPKTVKPSDFTKNINDPLLSTLVKMENTEFRDADTSKTYGSANAQVTSAVNFTMRSCGSTTSIVLRNSSYARFALINVPNGNGILTAVPSIFNGTMQLFIRDTADVQFNGPRCGTVSISKTISELKAYATGDSTIPDGVTIKGIVVSDAKNEAAGNYRLQDASGGIQLRFTTAANPAAVVGDSLTANLGGLTLSLFSGGLQVNSVETVLKSGTGNVTPRTVTVAQIKDNLRAWESTVVTIQNITVTTGTSNATGTNYIITDATGSINTFIRNTAGIIMPSGATSISGYVSAYQAITSGSPLEAQLTLRNQGDVAGGTGGAFSAVYDFGSVTSTSGNADPTAVPTTDGLTFSSFTAVGVGANSSGAGRFSFSGWPTGATNGTDVFTGVIDATKYYEVTITPTAGKKFDLTKITFTIQRSGTGVRQASIRSSIDAFATNLPAIIDPANTNLSVVPTNVFQVTDAITTAQEGCVIVFGNGYTNVSSAVVLRFYGYNGEAATGTFSIDNVKIEGNVK